MFPLRPFCVRGSAVSAPADIKQRDIIMMRTPKETALRTRCVERTRAMQLVCMCASRLVPALYRTFVSGMTWGTSMTKRRVSYV